MQIGEKKDVGMRLWKFQIKKRERERELFRAIFEQSPVGIVLGDSDNGVLIFNSTFEKIVGRSREELEKIDWKEITHPDDVQKDLELLEKVKSGKLGQYTISKRYIKKDGSIVWCNKSLVPLKGKLCKGFGQMCVIEDITERVIADEKLRESERSKAMLLANLPGMSYRCNYDRDWTMQFVSQGCYELTGYQSEDLLYNQELSFNDLIDVKYREYLWDKWAYVLKNKLMFREEYPITTATGEKKWVLEQGQGVYNGDNKVEAIEGLIIDISDRKKSEEEIRYLTYHDVMTGIHNRRYYEEQKNLLDVKGQLPLSVIVCDINGLKLINDAFGHLHGDKFIIAMANVLTKCLRNGDVLARTGGDEVSILLPKTSNKEARALIRQMEHLCNEYKILIEGCEYELSVSMGCATKAADDQSLNTIIKIADDNMYRRKNIKNRRLQRAMISSMKRTMLDKGIDEEEHIKTREKIALKIGKRMGLTEDQSQKIKLLSSLHNIGKIGISNRILNKKGELTEEEQIIMQKHSEIGYRIATAFPELSSIAYYILCHHEHYDGKGYPGRLRGKKIPLQARIISVVDAYDSMLQGKAIGGVRTKIEAINEIKRNSGTKFDSEIVDIFLEVVST